MKTTISALLVLVIAVAIFMAFFRPSAAKSDVADASKKQTVFVFVKIPEPMMPIERSEKYEDPLDSSLKQAGIGKVTGGGSQLGDPDRDGKREIEWVGIDVDLTDLAIGLPLLKAELKRLGAPVETTMEYELDGEQKSERLQD